MVKKITFTTVSIAAVMGITSNANAVEVRPYLGGNLQYVFENDENSVYENPNLSAQNSETTFDTGMGYGIAGGAVINQKYRAELELSQQKADVEKNNVFNYTTGEAETLAVMANGYYDFRNATRFTPYVGAGLGATQLTLELPTADDDDTVFAYQGLLGVSYDINQNNTVGLGYRYFATEDGTFADNSGDKFEGNYDSHSIELGYRYTF